MSRLLIRHTPRWQPADLPVDAAGNTRPGFVCAHPLENGNGPCEGDVFDISEAFGDHACIVDLHALPVVVGNRVAAHAECESTDHDRSVDGCDDTQKVDEDGLLACNHDGQPMFYCERTGRYHHLDPATPGCFLIPD